MNFNNFFVVSHNPRASDSVASVQRALCRDGECHCGQGGARVGERQREGEVQRERERTGSRQLQKRRRRRRQRRRDRQRASFTQFRPRQWLRFQLSQLQRTLLFAIQLSVTFLGSALALEVLSRLSLLLRVPIHPTSTVNSATNSPAHAYAHLAHLAHTPSRSHAHSHAHTQQNN